MYIIQTRTETYQLLQIPTADLHVALVLVQALSERLGILFTTSRPPAVALISSVLSLTRHGVVGLLRLGRGTGTTSKETPYRVADGTTHCDAAVKVVSSVSSHVQRKVTVKGQLVRCFPCLYLGLGHSRCCRCHLSKEARAGGALFRGHMRLLSGWGRRCGRTSRRRLGRGDIGSRWCSSRPRWGATGRCG